VETAAGTESLDFTVEIPAPARVTNWVDMVTLMTDLLNDTMDAQNDAFWQTSNPAPNDVLWVFLFNDDLDFTLSAAVCSINGDPTATRSKFLFGSGPSKGNGPERVFGYDEGIDTEVYENGIPPFLLPLYFPIAYHEGNLYPYQYVDVFIKEMESTLLTRVPSARIFVNDPDSYLRSQELPWRPRLMTSPLRWAEFLQVKLVLEDNINPSTLSTNGWDVTLDILSLANETSVPDWVRTRLQYP
jgi:hypothetical protein